MIDCDKISVEDLKPIRVQDLKNSQYFVRKIVAKTNANT